MLITQLLNQYELIVKCAMTSAGNTKLRKKFQKTIIERLIFLYFFITIQKINLIQFLR